eukprot:8106390-Alexandrium_andersonii.AAC.1
MTPTPRAPSEWEPQHHVTPCHRRTARAQAPEKIPTVESVVSRKGSWKIGGRALHCTQPR